MATSSTADSSSSTQFDTELASGPDDPAGQSDDSASRSDDSPTPFDRLETAARIIWAAFLALVVVYTLIPVVALWLGAVPFDPPPTAPYFALVGFALVGAAALIAAGTYDV